MKARKFILSALLAGTFVVTGCGTSSSSSDSSASLPSDSSSSVITSESSESASASTSLEISSENSQASSELPPVATLQSITVEEPTKTTYRVGEPFDETGLKVTAHYSDDTTAELSDEAYTITGFDSSVAGEVTLTVSYQGKQATFIVAIEAAPAAIEAIYTFDTAEDVAALPTPNESDAWCWPRSYSIENSHDGVGSLKVTPHPTDGTWPSVDFGTFDLSHKATVDLWVYFTGAQDFTTFALMFDNNKYQPITVAVAQTWTKFKVDAEIVASKVTDITNVSIKFGNVGSNYLDRSSLFLDSFNLVEKEGRDIPPAVEATHTFDSAEDVASLPTPTASDAWCLPRAFSEENSHDGPGSLKVTPHPTDGTWPVVDLGRHNLTNIETVELWFYNDSETDLDFMGLMFGVDATPAHTHFLLLSPKIWTKYEVAVSAVAEKMADLSDVRIWFGNVGSTYANRGSFFVDTFNLVAKEVVPVVKYTNSFDTAEDVAALPTPTEADAWCLPRAFSNEKAHDGAGSLKVTPHPTDGTWPVVDLGRHDLTNIETVELWFYNDSETDLDLMGLMFGVGAGADHTYYQLLAPKTWTKYEISVSTLAEKMADLSDVRIYFGNVGATYANRGTFYVDSFNLVAKD